MVGSKRGKQFVFDRNSGTRKRIHQGRLARVSVPHQSHGGERDFISFFSLQSSCAFHCFQTPFKCAIRSRILRRSTSNCVSPGPRVPMPPPNLERWVHCLREARQEIFQLSQLYLKLSLIAASALGEDVKNKLAAIDDSNLKRGFQIALLCRAQILIDDHKIGLQVFEGDWISSTLPRPTKVAGVTLRTCWLNF